MKCAVLDVAEALPNLVSFLSSRDCQSLRSTCALLRRHAAVVDGIRDVQDHSLYQQGLRQLRSLQVLHLQSPPSVFDAHHLAGLSYLTRVVIAETCVVDLKPLSFLASLRHLQLWHVQHHASLDSLTQLDALYLGHAPATPELLQLSRLTWLCLSEGSQAGSLGALSQLATLNIFSGTCGPDNWPPDAVAALAATVSAGLPALRDLSCCHLNLPPLPSLAQLTALDIWCHNLQLPAALQDLRQLTGLAKLGLNCYAGQPELQSDSVTALYLNVVQGGECRFPILVGCSTLSQIALDLALDDDAATYDICAGQLPPTASTLMLNQKQGRLFLEVQAAEVLRVRRVKQLHTWTDVDALEAEDC